MASCFGVCSPSDTEVSLARLPLVARGHSPWLWVAERTYHERTEHPLDMRTFGVLMLPAVGAGQSVAELDFFGMPFDTECRSRLRTDCDPWMEPRPAGLAPWNITSRLRTGAPEVYAPWPWDLARLRQDSLLAFRGRRYELSNGDSVSLFNVPPMRARAGAARRPPRARCCFWPAQRDEPNASWVVRCDRASCNEATANYTQPQILLLRSAEPSRIKPVPNNTWVEVLRQPSGRELRHAGCALAGGSNARPACASPALPHS